MTAYGIRAGCLDSSWARAWSPGTSRRARPRTAASAPSMPPATRRAPRSCSASAVPVLPVRTSPGPRSCLHGVQTRSLACAALLLRPKSLCQLWLQWVKCAFDKSSSTLKGKQQHTTCTLQFWQRSRPTRHHHLSQRDWHSIRQGVASSVSCIARNKRHTLQRPMRRRRQRAQGQSAHPQARRPTPARAPRPPHRPPPAPPAPHASPTRRPPPRLWPHAPAAPMHPMLTDMSGSLQARMGRMYYVWHIT